MSALNLKINDNCPKLVKKYEGLHDGDSKQTGLQPKLCPANIWTEGYGRAMFGKDGKFLTKANTTKAEAEARAVIKTEAQAEQALKEDLEEYSNRIIPFIKVPLTENQFGACVSLAYNIGHGAFSRSSVLKFINAKDFNSAAKSFLLWNKAGGKVLPGLDRRRKEEMELFMRK